MIIFINKNAHTSMYTNKIAKFNKRNWYNEILIVYIVTLKIVPLIIFNSLLPISALF